MDAASFADALHCAVCSRPLVSPTTLRCGHSVCILHAPLRCPNPLCVAPPRPTHPTPSVTYFPAPMPSSPSSPANTAPDFLLNKLIHIFNLYTTQDSANDSQDDQDNDDGDDDRPRKRLRHTHPRPDTDPNSQGGPPDPRIVPPELAKELASHLTCEICFMLLHEPITTPCQHTFCSKCLLRSLDHSSACPLCRHDMPGFAYFQDHPTNKIITTILLRAFPASYAARGVDEHDARLDTPIFVCQLSFPGMPTILHFFEPRYRLMLRRCLESRTPRFGMIMPPRTAPTPASPAGAQSSGNDFGTMLEIRSVQMLPDGRSVVDTFGTHRFRILERGTLDGYMIGRVERIDDFEEELESDSEDGDDEYDEGDVDDAAAEPQRKGLGGTSGSAAEQQGGEGAEVKAERVEEVPVPSTSRTALQTFSSQESSLEEGPSAAEGSRTTRSRSSPGASSSADSSTALTPTTRPPPSLSPLSLSPTPSPRPHPRRTARLLHSLHAFLLSLRSGSAPWVVRRLDRTLGPPPPPDDPRFAWWVALALPVEEGERAKLLAVRSARLRVRMVARWVEALERTWWFSSGCVVV